MPMKFAERLKDTVSLVEERVKNGQSEDTFRDLTFLSQQYSDKGEWDKANSASRYMLALAEGRNDCTFDVLPEDIDFHLARNYWIAKRGRNAIRFIVALYCIVLPPMFGFEYLLEKPMYVANIRCAVLSFDPQSFIMRAQCQQQNGDTIDAMADCNKALSIAPANKAAHQTLAYCLLDRGDYDEAWRQNELSDHSAPPYLDVKSMIQLRRGDIVSAAYNQHRAGELTNDYRYYLTEHNVWASACRYSSALDAAKSAETAANSDSSRCDAYTAEARSLVNLGRFDEALAACKKAVALKPRSPVPHGLRAEALLGKHDHSGAVEAATTALALNHFCNRALKARAEALKHLGRTDDAIADLNALSAIGWNPWLDN